MNCSTSARTSPNRRTSRPRTRTSCASSTRTHGAPEAGWRQAPAQEPELRSPNTQEPGPKPTKKVLLLGDSISMGYTRMSGNCWPRKQESSAPPTSAAARRTARAPTRASSTSTPGSRSTAASSTSSTSTSACTT